ncbi:hypothetical protein TNCV_2867071 [Trichonephila clavipes]|nr:hypothetical protein TNCV_2867071 [Trichonephila clavipes]
MTKEWSINPSTSTIESNLQIVEIIVMERVASAQRRYQTFCKQKVNHLSPFHLSADRQWRWNVEWSVTPPTTTSEEE